MIGNHGPEDLLRALLSCATGVLMEMEVAALAGAGLNAHCPDGRTAHRNGYRQRCRVHRMRNMPAYVAKKNRPITTALLKTIFVQAEFQTHSPKLAKAMGDSQNQVPAYMDFPKEHRQQIHPTNPIERLNKEIKRRTRVVEIFPNGQAIIRPVGALLPEQNDDMRSQDAT